MFKSCSSISSFQAFLLFWCLFLSTVKTEECIDVANPKTKLFHSLLDLQTYNETFDPRKPNFKGNYVMFDKIKIPALDKNSFITQDSSHIEKLSLGDHGISRIDDGAFTSLKCLRYLELQKNNVVNISKGVFQNLTKLYELNLAENYVVEIPEQTFTFLVRLKKLNIARNKLKVIHPESFFGLSRLEELDLSDNHLSVIPPESLDYFSHLTHLQLGSNQIDYLELDKSKNLVSLKVLNLSNNVLECFDTTYNYSFSGNLTELYLNGNNLVQLNHYGFQKSLPVLKVIDLNDNFWNCTELVPVIQVLNDLRIKYKHSPTSDPNVGGIACNKTLNLHKKNTTNYDVPTQFDTTTNLPKSTQAVEIKPTESAPQHSVSSDELDSIKRTQTIMMCFLVIIVIFIVADVAVRCGCLNVWFNRRRQTFLDNADDDNGSLLQDRF